MAAFGAIMYDVERLNFRVKAVARWNCPADRGVEWQVTPDEDQHYVYAVAL